MRGKRHLPVYPRPMDAGRLLVDELTAMGVKDARVDENGYVYGTVPANGDHPARVGLIAHMDTSDGVKGPTHPQVVPCYEGGPITLKMAWSSTGLISCPAWWARS